MTKQSKKQSDTLPPLNYALAARAEGQAQLGGAWSLRHLRICWAWLGIAGALITGAGLTHSVEAGLGAILGSVIVGCFFSFSAIAIARVGAKHPARVMWVALCAYVVKMIALGGVIALIPRDGIIDTRWMAGAVALGLMVWLAAHMRFVWTNKILYVSPR